MKRFSYIVSLLALLLCTLGSVAQQSQTYKLNSALNGSQIQVPSEGVRITDDDALGSEGYYACGTDRCVTLYRTCSGNNHLALSFSVFDIDPLDTLYFYDGNNITAPLLLVANNDINSLSSGRNKVFVSPNNSANCITVRFKTSMSSSSSHKGFEFSAGCDMPCEIGTPYLLPTFYRERNGVVYDTVAFADNVTTSGKAFTSANLCYGDVVIFEGGVKFTHDYGWFEPVDTNSTFSWDLGIDRVAPVGVDVVSGMGLTKVRTAAYSDTTGCFDVILTVTDTFGCPSTLQAGFKVRISKNPIRTIVSPLPTFCSNDSMLVRISSDMFTGHLVVDTMSQVTEVSRTNKIRTFIPDGPNCTRTCYSAPVVFTEFSASNKVESKDDICSVCINMEHSYMGDFDLKLICPSGKRATLKYKNAPAGYPAGAGGGGSVFLGYPYGGAEAKQWDGGEGKYCDTAYNMYGIGLDYCFSRNADYTLVDGRPANTSVNAQHYLGNVGVYIDQVTVAFPSRPAGYTRSGSSDAGRRTFMTKHASNRQKKLDYYKPADDFSNLVGCPLNGTWQVEVCDEWAKDNGWIFSWSMEFCNIDDDRDCRYQVGIDSIRWQLDTSVGRIFDGRYYGPKVSVVTDSTSLVYMVDTAGYFPMKVHVYDNYGCVWDTNTYIHTIWAPKPSLGPSRIICNADTAVITATDPHYNVSFTYKWAPNGETSPSISTPRYMGANTDNFFTVTVTNTEDPLVENCATTDSVLVSVLPQPLPNFDASIYPMEGCEPLHESITNHSQYTDSYFWDFGDGTTSTEAEPSHTYSAGVYDLKYYVANNNGCKDSLVLTGVVNVFANPVADFSWSPAFPTVTYPTVQFENRSTMADDIEYSWEVQYSPDNESSFTTLTEQNPSYTWTFGENTDGARFATRLIATQALFGPSGREYRCSDTVENIVLVINDFLQFPTVVTANGDGTNDRFVIKNLVKGWAFPINCLDIYNRWGARIFHAENISSEDDFWSPADTHSPTGTYFYRFTARGHTGVVERNGCVEVIR